MVELCGPFVETVPLLVPGQRDSFCVQFVHLRVKIFFLTHGKTQDSRTGGLSWIQRSLRREKITHASIAERCPVYLSSTSFNSGKKLVWDPKLMGLYQYTNLQWISHLSLSAENGLSLLPKLENFKGIPQQSSLGSVYMRHGKSASARELLVTALDTRTQTLQKMHPSILLTKNVLACPDIYQGR